MGSFLLTTSFLDVLTGLFRGKTGWSRSRESPWERFSFFIYLKGDHWSLDTGNLDLNKDQS